MNWAGEALPTGDLTTSAITLENMAPCMICANSTFEYRIRVHNISGSKLNNVVVSDSLPGEGYKYEGATPSSKRSSTGLRWEFGDMKPGAIEEITVHARKVPEKEQSTPVAVTPFTEAAMEREVDRKSVV